METGSVILKIILIIKTQNIICLFATFCRRMRKLIFIISHLFNFYRKFCNAINSHNFEQTKMHRASSIMHKKKQECRSKNFLWSDIFFLLGLCFNFIFILLFNFWSFVLFQQLFYTQNLNFLRTFVQIILNWQFIQRNQSTFFFIKLILGKI